jgi:hypothetical protein
MKWWLSRRGRAAFEKTKPTMEKSFFFVRLTEIEDGFISIRAGKAGEIRYPR